MLESKLIFEISDIFTQIISISTQLKFSRNKLNIWPIRHAYTRNCRLVNTISYIIYTSVDTWTI
jgi:hypothetical protein